jgi:hypothetical protein
MGYTGKSAGCRATRLFTAPGKTKVATVVAAYGDSEPPPMKVLEDGVTIVASKGAMPEGETDPSGRWKGVGPRSIERLSDHVVLVYDDAGLHTESGHFDTLGAAARTTFALGDDPRNAPIFRADRLQPLLHHPKLAEEFFGGAPLIGPLEVIAKPPTLALTKSEVLADRVRLVVAAGEGTKTIRTWRDGLVAPSGEIVPAASNTIEIPIAHVPSKAPRSCVTVAVYACNDSSCTPPVRAQHCVDAKGKLLPK